MASLYASLENGKPYVLSILRIIVALLFLEHGLQKYLGFPSAGPPMTSLLYVQGAIEIVGGILLLVGAYTRVVAFILAGDMAAAYFMAHFPLSFFPALTAYPRSPPGKPQPPQYNHTRNADHMRLVMAHTFALAEMAGDLECHRNAYSSPWAPLVVTDEPLVEMVAAE
jgi:putative oxidoreductase